MTATDWSWLLFPFGIAGQLMVGGRNRNRWGWALSIATQLIWLLMAFSLKMYGLMPGSASYLLVYLKNFFGWQWDLKALALKLWRRFRKEKG